MPGDGTTTLLKCAVNRYRSELESGSTRAREALANSTLKGLLDDEIVRLGEDGEPESTMIH